MNTRTTTGRAAPDPEARAPGASAYGQGVSRAVTETGTTPETTPETSAEERYFIASQRQLMWRKFKKHRLAVISGLVLILAYLAAFTFEFCAPYGALTQHEGFVNAPPTRIRVIDPDGRLRAPFVYGLTGKVNMETFQREFVEDTAEIHPLRFFAHGEAYRFWGSFDGSRHLFDAGEGRIFLLGTAKLAGSHTGSIIVSHLLPGFLSYLIVRLTLAIPGMILGETALSFLGLGIQPPAVSWGTLLQGAQNVTNIAIYPWLLTPALFVVVTVLLYNFMGDGLRDAADPYAMSGRG